MSLDLNHDSFYKNDIEVVNHEKNKPQDFYDPKAVHRTI